MVTDTATVTAHRLADWVRLETNTAKLPLVTDNTPALFTGYSY